MSLRLHRLRSGSLDPWRRRTHSTGRVSEEGRRRISNLTITSMGRSEIKCRLTSAISMPDTSRRFSRENGPSL
jgi:hypothetical protein